MRIPPRGERHVAANWIAVATAVATVVIGSSALLVVRDDLPERIVVRWDNMEPVSTLSLSAVLVLGATLTLGGCLLLLGAGIAVQRSFRHGLAGHAAGAGLGLGSGLYAMSVAQVQGREAGGPWMFYGLMCGLMAGVLVTRWVRQQPEVLVPSAPQAVQSLQVPATARLAWNGWTRPARGMRLSFLTLYGVMVSAFYWWIGFTVLALLPLAGGLIGQLIATRRRQFVIDYSGVGLRGKYGSLPPPIYLADISSAEAASVSALREFGGWGNVKSPDGRDGWITRTGEALVVHRRRKPDFVVTVDHAAEAAAVLNTLVARLEASRPNIYGVVDVGPAAG